MKKNENSGPDSGVVLHHKADWSAYEHSVAREQFSEYGVCFTDDMGRPIDDPEGVKCLAETRLAA